MTKPSAHAPGKDPQRMDNPSFFSDDLDDIIGRDPDFKEKFILELFETHRYIGRTKNKVFNQIGKELFHSDLSQCVAAIARTIAIRTIRCKNFS